MFFSTFDDTKQKERQSYVSEGKLSKQYKNGNTPLCFRFIPNASGLKVYKHPGFQVKLSFVQTVLFVSFKVQEKILTILLHFLPVC